MPLPERDAAADWVGRTVIDRDGVETGVCTALLADDATGRPEWMYAELDGQTVVVPLLDATAAGDRVRVRVTRAQVTGALQPEDSPRLSAEQEASLYAHYGIEYSADASETLLPVEEPAGGAAAAPGRVAAVLALLAGLALAAAAVLRRRRPAAPGSRRSRREARAAAAATRARSQRLAARSHELAAHAHALAGSAAPATRRLVEQAAHAGAPRAREAADSLARQAQAASVAVRARTAQLATTAVPRAADLGQAGLRAALGAIDAAEAVPEAVQESGRRLRKGWRQATRAVSLGAGLGTGYVLGARAGRERYEQLARVVTRLRERPQVQHALDRLQAAAPPPHDLEAELQREAGTGAAAQGPEVGPDLISTAPLVDVDPEPLAVVETDAVAAEGDVTATDPVVPAAPEPPEPPDSLPRP